MFAGHRVFRPSIARCHEPVLIALLLLLGGVEQNPGPVSAGVPGTVKPAVALRLGVLNARSAVHKATLIHDIIDSQLIDMLVLTETWMSANQPAAITRDVVPPGYSVAHRFRDVGASGGVAIVHRQELTVAPVALTTAIQSLESLMLKLITQRSRVNVAALYRPPSSSPYGVTASQFCGFAGVSPTTSMSCWRCLVTCYCAVT